MMYGMGKYVFLPDINKQLTFLALIKHTDVPMLYVNYGAPVKTFMFKIKTQDNNIY